MHTNGGQPLRPSRRRRRRMLALGYAALGLVLVAIAFVLAASRPGESPWLSLLFVVDVACLVIILNTLRFWSGV